MWRKGHNRRRPFETRFWEKVNKNGPVPEHRPDLGACWVWTGALNHHGYGSLWVGRRHVLAHIVSYKLAKGDPPAGFEHDHLCRVRRCVNPPHIELVSPYENFIRGESGAAKNRIKTHCLHGHEFTPVNTYFNPAGYRHCRACVRVSQKRYYQVKAMKRA